MILFYDVYMNQLNTGDILPIEALMKSHRGINVYVYDEYSACTG